MTLPGLGAKPTTIYRQYDRCGCLLYVGIAYDAVARSYGHRGGSWWAEWIDRIDTSEQTFDDRRQALDAERESIRTESPVFNTVHALGRGRAIIRYLIEHERWEHLSVTAPVSPSQKPQLLRTLAEANRLDSVEWMKEPAEHDVDWSDPLLRRFIAKTETDDKGCWKWQGAFRDQQYPTFRHPETRMAARAAWLLFRGPIPDGVMVTQQCGVPDCVNPRHLSTRTPKEARGMHGDGPTRCDTNHPGSQPRWMKRSDGRSACRECNRVREAQRKLLRDSCPTGGTAP